MKVKEVSGLHTITSEAMNTEAHYTRRNEYERGYKIRIIH